MSAVALLATVVQRIRIGYFPIRIEITYPRSDNLSAYSHHGRRYVGGMQWLSSGLRADDLKPGTGPGVARDLRLKESCAAPLGRGPRKYSPSVGLSASVPRKNSPSVPKSLFLACFPGAGRRFSRLKLGQAVQGEDFRAHGVATRPVERHAAPIAPSIGRAWRVRGCLASGAWPIGLV